MAARFAAALLVAALAAAPAAAESGIGGKHDTSLPIEITADSLEVHQEQKVAVFRGNVDAVQGELTLRADELTVHYEKGAGENNSIRRIEAEGNVFLSSPSEIAQGERGVYDVDADRVELTGAVVLTRGENVIRGDRLEMDLATGRSEVKSVARDDGGEGRVKALFVPQSKSSE